jgi:hypothetical protein
MTWEWLLAISSGAILGVAGKFFWQLIRRLNSPRGEAGKTVYLEPSRAKDLIHVLDKEMERTLQEIDRGYAARRRDFTTYLDAQRDAIAADLKPPDGQKK